MLFRKKLSAKFRQELDGFIREHYTPIGDTNILEDTEDLAASAAAEPLYAAPAAVKAPKKQRPAESARTFQPMYGAAKQAMPAAAMPDLDKQLRMLDESFQQMLLRKIDEKGMKDSDCYKRAGVDRKLFSKIRSNTLYKPKKSTAIAFCIALRLSFDESVEMLRKAGYALSRSSKFDVIVEYFIRRGRYDINELNIALYEYDQNLIP